MRMNIWTWTAGLLVAGAIAGGASAQPPPAEARSVSCYANGGYEALEQRALKTALRGANRVSAHDLTVNTVAGVMRFTDRKPYRNGLSGFHWLYCGYVPKLQAHLIGVFDEDLFSGKLLFDRSGKTLDAGRTVYPSPGGKLFLAANQKNGNALEDWVLSDLAGRRLWAGPSGLTEKDAVLVEYGTPRWISDREIRVAARCSGGGAKGAATLVREGDAWRWRGKLQCGVRVPVP
jgi:hypothetical protein